MVTRDQVQRVASKATSLGRLMMKCLIEKELPAPDGLDFTIISAPQTQKAYAICSQTLTADLWRRA